MSKVIDLTEKSFGRLKVISFHSVKNGNALWLCECNCGKRIVTHACSLKKGVTKSCGCLRWPNRRTHGESANVKEYKSWANMRNRCLNVNNDKYHHYGGRGIQVCERWRNSYENFLADMGRAPSQKHTIDRIDNDGNYEPSNCKWATRKEQANNRRPRSR